MSSWIDYTNAHSAEAVHDILMILLLEFETKESVKQI